MEIKFDNIFFRKICNITYRVTRGAFRKMKRVSCSFPANRYHYIFAKICNDMRKLPSFYTKILLLLHELEPMDNFFNQTRVPKASDKALIALTLAAESVGIDSERYLFKQFAYTLIGRIERSV